MTELTLKEQYTLRKKEHEQKKLIEAVDLLEAHVLILEKLDTASIERVIDAMNAIEQGLAPFTAQVPAFKQALDAAEADLTNLVSGRAGQDPKKVNAILGKALSLYQGLAEFFRQDLPVLMKSKLFNAAKVATQTSKPMSAVPGMNVAALEKAFENALAIRQTGGLLKRLFTGLTGGNNLPYVNNKTLAQQLMSLSFENLTKLSGLASMPALADQASVQQAAQAAVGPAASVPPPAPAAAGGAKAAAAAAPAAAAPAAGGRPATPPDEASLSKAIEKIGGIDAIGKMIASKNVSDPRVLARLLATAIAQP